MRRTATLLAVLLALFWQGLALAGPGAMVAGPADSEHAALHWQEAGHHHHDGGVYHIDDSGESLQHLTVDHLPASTALLSSPVSTLPRAGATAPHGPREASVPSPVLDGPLRPPRHLS